MDITNQQKENIQLCVDALKVNPKKAIGQMSNSKGGRCCLCVMQDTLKEKYPKDYQNMTSSQINPDFKTFQRLLGFNPKHKFVIGGDNTILANHNDGHEDIKEKSHVQIAEALELKFLK